jgi:hypothetical protein
MTEAVDCVEIPCGDEELAAASKPLERASTVLDRLVESMKDWVDPSPSHQRMFPDQ